MHLLSINELFANRAVTALCWTLFHSLWQGLIVAVLAALLLIRTKQSRPTLRYQLLSTLFFLLTFLFAATFLYELQHSGVAPGGGGTNVGRVMMLNQKMAHPVILRTGEGPLLIQTISGFLSRNSSLIVGIWFIILSVRMARMLFVLGYTRHIVRHRSHEPSLYWKQRLILLCHQLRITKPVTLLESKIAKLPVVMGQLKPVILVPVGLLAQLAPDQVEAILLHELAHIRRNDYLVNLLQNIIETLFFFNPALLWLSSLIRDERENCCDDVAIEQLKSKKQYVESLISFRERSLYSSSFSAVGFAGRKNSFINRITRIVENKNYTPSPFEKGSLACSSVVAASLALVVAVPNGTSLIQPAPKFAQVETVSRWTMVVSTRRVDTLAGAGASYLRIRKKVRGGADAGDGAGAGQGIKKIDTLKGCEVLALASDTNRREDYFFILTRMHQVIADLVMEKVVPDSAAVESFALDKNILTVNDQPQSEALHEKLKLKYNTQDLGLYYGPEKVTGHGFFIHEKPSPPPSVSHRPVMRLKPFPADFRLEPIIADFVNDLVAEGIVKDITDPVSFLLTNRKLVVNGQLQPEGIHEQLKAKYISPNRYVAENSEMAKDPDFGLHYNSKTGSMGIGIHHWAENALP
jgi:bla regulator protein BlaR1